MVYNPPEQTIIQNGFGIVTDRRVTYPHRNGRQDIPLQHIVSVSYETECQTALGLFFLILGLIALSLKTIASIVVAAVLIWVGVMLLRNSPVIIITTAGGNRIPVTGNPGQKQEAEVFANALRSQLFNKPLF